MATPDDITPLATLLARLPDNTSGQITAQDMRDTVSDLYDGIVKSLWKQGTEVTMTGTETELITNIGAEATVVRISMRDLESTSGGASDWMGLQLGGSSSYLDQVGDYSGFTYWDGGQGFNWDINTSAAVAYADDNNPVNGQVVLSKMAGNLWNIATLVQRDVNGVQSLVGAGYVDLSAQELSRIKLIIAAGGNSFNSGTVQVDWQ